MAWTERYVRADADGSGNGTTDANSGANGAWTLAQAIAGVAAGQRVNIKAGTYANTTTDRTFGTSGTTTAPIWWRGFSSTIGDLDADFTTAKPSITFTTGRFIPSGSHQYFSNLSISGAQTTNGQIRPLTGTNIRIHRCRIECTSANANGRAVFNSATMMVFSDCWFKSTSSADVVDNSGTQTTYIGCVFEGGAHGVNFNGVTSGAIQFCVFNNQGGDAIRTSASGALSIIANSIYSPASDGIEFSTLPSLGIVFGNIFSECGGYGINNSTGANTNMIQREHNDFHSNTSGNMNGLGDSVDLANQTESASPYTDAASSDFSLLSTSNAKANSFPGRFENQSYLSYLDIGAVQRQEGGGLFKSLPMHGGMNRT